MGIIPKPDPDPDDSCPVCFPAGKTPSGLKIFFNGIKGGQLSGGASMAEYNRYFDVPRRVGLPCKFSTPDGIEPHINVSVARAHTQVIMGHEGRGGIFQSWDVPPCTPWVENQRQAAGSYGWKGWCFISFPGEKSGEFQQSITSLASLIEQVTPMIDPDPRMECFPMADEHIAVRYAGKRDATNIMIKFDTNP